PLCPTLFPYNDALPIWTDSNQENPMAQMATWASTVGGGMPVYIGEWGVGWGSRYTTLTCNNIRQWYTTFDSVYAASHNQPTAVRSEEHTSELQSRENLV